MKKSAKKTKKAARNDRDTDKAPRSELTAEEAAKVAAKRKTKAAKESGEPKPKRVSAIDAAAQVLRKSGKPLDCKTMIERMAEQGLWSSPGGKTPAATLYSAILREIGTKGRESRFKKVERGQFEFAGKEA